MKTREIKRVKTITAKDPQDFDRLYNDTADELAKYDPETVDLDAFTTRFYYTITEGEAETTGDEFTENGMRCTCADCPFLQVDGDQRKKWHACEYAAFGQARLDSPACEVFYREAVKLMREKAGR